jgi:hypothetical protein
MPSELWLIKAFEINAIVQSNILIFSANAVNRGSKGARWYRGIPFDQIIIPDQHAMFQIGDI